MTMDEIDRKLLGLLQEDATVGMSQLADQVGLSPTPVWKRIQKLFAAALEAMPEVMDAYRMAGEVDYMLRVAVPGMTEFDSFYKRLIAAVPLKNVTSRFAMERLKQTTAYPLPDKSFRDRRAGPGEG
jgi:Lrp/AsnC family transcriptional regulator